MCSLSAHVVLSIHYFQTLLSVLVIISFGSFIYYYQLSDLKRSFHLITVFNSLFFLVKCLQDNATLQAVQRNGMQSRSLAIGSKVNAEGLMSNYFLHIHAVRPRLHVVHDGR